MTICYALLLDGGFLRYKLSKRNWQVDAAGVSAFTEKISALPCLHGMRLHRIYFYDSEPLTTLESKPLGGGQVNFGSSPVAARSKRLQSALMKEPFFALRFGELHMEGWRLKPKVLSKPGPSIQIAAEDLEPNIRQKG